METLAGVQAGDGVDGIFGVSKKEVKQTKNGNPYLRLRLVDRTGELWSIMFSDKIGDVNTWEKIEEGQMIGIKGEGDEYNGRISIKIAALDLDPPAPTNGEVSLSPEVDPNAIEESKKLIVDTIASMTNKRLMAVCNLTLNWFEAEYWESPCHTPLMPAKGELALHVADCIRHINGSPGVPPQMKEVLHAAAILHDLEQTSAWDWSGLVPVPTVQTKYIISGFRTAQMLGSLCLEADLLGSLRTILENTVFSSFVGNHGCGTAEGEMFKTLHTAAVQQRAFSEALTRAPRNGTEFVVNNATFNKHPYGKDEGWSE